MATQNKAIFTHVLTSLKLKLKAMSVMSIAIWLSLGIHLLILAIHFEPALKKFTDNLPVLEVMLVNSKTSSKPVKADVFAQANLDRGGNTDQNRKIKSALPVLKQQKTAPDAKPLPVQKTGAKLANQRARQTKVQTSEQKHIALLEKQALALMTQLNSPQKVQSQVVPVAKLKELESSNQAPVSKKLDMQEITANALEMDRLEALIAKQQDDYQKRPRRKFIGARAKEYRYALYVDSWRQKVEKYGNLNYPVVARDLKLYGNLQMTVSINADGSVEKIEVSRSSGNKLLDESAKQIVEQAAPYARFPNVVQKEIDILSITRTWTFSKEDSIATGE